MLEFECADDYVRSADVLRAADFTEESIQRALGRTDILAMPASDVPRALRATAEETPLNTLIRLLFIGLPVPVEAARAALRPMSLETWVRAELLCPPDGQGQVEPRVQIWPVRGRWMVVDLPWRRDSAPPADFVVPPGPLTLQLADLSIERPCSQALDLGTGSGALAMMIAPRAETVYATDSNARALAFAQFNLRLNGIENVRCLLGDLFDPVADRQFDLILCNPPFVISPTRRFSFRDSGERGDLFCRRLIAAAVERLAPVGFFQCTGNIAHVAGRSWKADLEEWFAGLGCDVLVFVEREESAANYAMNWILATETKEPRQVADRYDVWTDYFERERIEAVSYLYMTMRRGGGGDTWIEIDDPPCRIAGPCGAEVLRFFQTRDEYGSPSSAGTLLNKRVRIAPDIRMTQDYVAGDKGLELREIRVNKTAGLQYTLAIHRNVAAMLAACDGLQTAGELLAEMASALDLSLEQAGPVVLPAIRSLVERGVLVECET
jgi:methylase of polypeptide subunit release factors